LISRLLSAICPAAVIADLIAAGTVGRGGADSF